VKAEVTGDALGIRGERKYEREDKNGAIYRSGRRCPRPVVARHGTTR
jgi:hypothetical protein